MPDTLFPSMAPLTPPEADLRDYTWMKLDVVRLRDSDLAGLAHAEAFRCAMLLFAAAYHQLPAGSLPNDEASLCKLAGYGRDMKTFRHARANGGMRGWQVASDGRLYHKVVAEKVCEAWAGKLEQRQRTEAARLARAKKRKDAANSGDPGADQTTPKGRNGRAVKTSVTSSVTETAADIATSTVTEPVATSSANVSASDEEPVLRQKDIKILSESHADQKMSENQSLPPSGRSPSEIGDYVDKTANALSVTETVTSSRGEEKRREESTDNRSLRSLPRPRPVEGAFDDFWAAYPRKVGKEAARRAFALAAKRASLAEIGTGLARQSWPDNPQFIPHPATWLSQGRWQDDPTAAAPPAISAETKFERSMRQVRANLETDSAQHFAGDLLQ